MKRGRIEVHSATRRRPEGGETTQAEAAVALTLRDFLRDLGDQLIRIDDEIEPITQGPWVALRRCNRQPKAHGACRRGLSRCPWRSLRRVVGASKSRSRRTWTLPGHRGGGGRLDKGSGDDKDSAGCLPYPAPRWSTRRSSGRGEEDIGAAISNIAPLRESALASRRAQAPDGIFLRGSKEKSPNRNGP